MQREPFRRSETDDAGRPGRRGLLLGIAAAAGVAAPAMGQQRPAGPEQPGAALISRASAGTVGVVSGGVDGTYVRIAADLAAVLDGEGLRVVAMLGKGSLQNLADILFMRGVDIGIVQSDALAYARRERLFPGIDRSIQYIAKLYDEEVHVLARRDTARIEDLAGQVVNVDQAGSGTAMTASLVFGGLGIAIRPAHDPQDVALVKLRRGEIAALVYVAGKPARLFGGIGAQEDLRFLPVPVTPALLETYLPAQLGHAQYPALVPQEAPVETIAVGAVMAVFAWQQGTERHRRVARFVESFVANFDAFLRPPRHPKWQEVNLGAQVPGWIRFNPAVSAARR